MSLITEQQYSGAVLGRVNGDDGLSASSVDEKADFKRREQNKPVTDVEIANDDAEHEYESRWSSWYSRLRPFILVGLMLVILGWWISSMILTRYRW